MWTIYEIAEDDFGCEERMPGEPLMVLVTLEDDFGRRVQFPVPDVWLRQQELDEGDEWPEDIETPTKEEEGYAMQMSWMENYLNALEEL